MNEPNRRLDRAVVERQITEMWSTLADAPRDEHYDAAYRQCAEAESRMRAQLAAQDRLDAAAPRLLVALEQLSGRISAMGCALRRHNLGGWVAEWLGDDVLDEARAAIAEAQGDRLETSLTK